MKAKRAVGALSALAQETRLAAFRMLVREAPDGVTAGVIAERLRVPPATLSFHLAQLEHARLVRARRHVLDRGFPVYPSFERGAAALGRVANYYANREARAAS